MVGWLRAQKERGKRAENLCSRWSGFKYSLLWRKQCEIEWPYKSISVTGERILFLTGENWAKLANLGKTAKLKMYGATESVSGNVIHCHPSRQINGSSSSNGQEYEQRMDG